MYFVMDLYLIVLCLLVIYIKGKLKGIYDFILWTNLYINIQIAYISIYSNIPTTQSCEYVCIFIWELSECDEMKMENLE